MIFLWANIRNSWQVKPFGGGGGEETSWDLLSLQEWDWDTRILLFQWLFYQIRKTKKWNI